jgi:hypothetical protein
MVITAITIFLLQLLATQFFTWRADTEIAGCYHDAEQLNTLG